MSTGRFLLVVLVSFACTFFLRSDIPGGSTLGSIASTLVPVEMADIGLAQLAMHSCFETAGVSDILDMVNICTAMFSSSIEKSGGRIRLV